jgi:SCY1-like protein 1
VVLQVRHPNVLAFRDTLEVDEKGAVTLYVITEPVTPLVDILENLQLKGSSR